MKKTIIVFLLLAGTMLSYAQRPGGTIPFDCPDVPPAKFQFNLNHELISLISTTEPFDAVENLYVHTYDAEEGLFDKLVEYYGEKLNQNRWESFAADENWQISVLNDSVSEDTCTGIFAIVKSRSEVHLLNVVGQIPKEQIGALLANLNVIGIWIPELRSLDGTFELPNIQTEPVISKTEEILLDKKSLTMLQISEDSPNPYEAGLIPLSQRYWTPKGDFIDEIQVEGNRSVELDEIVKMLEDGPVEIEAAAQKLAESIPEFEDIQVSIKKSGLQHIATINIIEKSLPLSTYTTTIPRIGFNRVTGWELGARVETGLRSQKRDNITPFEFDWYSNIPIEKDNSKLFAQFGYGFGNKQLYYRIGGDRIWGENGKWNLGLSAQFQRAITTIAPELFAGYDETGTLFLRIVGVPDHQDYYLRNGAEIALQWQPKRSINFNLSMLWETHESLHKTTDWHIFNLWSSSKVRENLVITPGNMRSINFKFDSNDRYNYLGWHNTVLVEHSNRNFGSDFDWTRFQTHLRYAVPYRNNQLRTRFVLSSVVGKPDEDHFSTAILPIQRQFVIGGIGTLNGYPLYTFAGDHGYLFNVEFLIGLPNFNKINVLNFINVNVLNNIHVVLLFDQGQVWNELGSDRHFKPKGSAGIGLQVASEVDIFRFNVAKAFDAEQDIQFNLMFFYSF